MIGDEPYGNYNRIMLSHVLSGEATTNDEPHAQPHDLVSRKRRQAHVGDRAMAGPFMAGSDLREWRVVGDDVLIIATGSSYCFFPNMDGLREADGRLARGVSASVRLPTPTDSQDGAGP